MAQPLQLLVREQKSAGLVLEQHYGQQVDVLPTHAEELPGVLWRRGDERVCARVFETREGVRNQALFDANPCVMRGGEPHALAAGRKPSAKANMGAEERELERAESVTAKLSQCPPLSAGPRACLAPRRSSRPWERCSTRRFGVRLALPSTPRS